MVILQIIKNLIEIGKKESDEPILVNILTRTSGRPKAFKMCRESIEKQSYSHFKQYVSYDNLKDLEYIKYYDVEKIKVSKKTEQEVNQYFNPGNREFSPYNLYCNDLLSHVKKGWILFLDDDDMLAHEKVLENIVTWIKKEDKKTLFIWQMQYPDGKLLPPDELMKKEEIKIYNIGSPCFLFHHKYAHRVNWDPWKCADFRFLKNLSNIIPNKKWIRQPLVKLNNSGDLGQRNDLE